MEWINLKFSDFLKDRNLPCIELHNCAYNVLKMLYISSNLFLTMALLGGAWVAQLVKHLPLAQVVIPGSSDRVSWWAACSAGSLLLLLPTTPPACAVSLSCSLSQINKYF